MGEESFISFGMAQLDDGTVVTSEDTGADVFGDTMLLAIQKTLRDVYASRVIVFSAVAGGGLWGAYGFDNDAFSIASGVVTAVSGLAAIYNGIRLIPAARQYSRTLDDVASHGWAPREQLEKIDSRYL